MKTKEIYLTHSWSLIIHESYSSYVNQNDENKFIVVNQEDDSLATLTITDSSVAVDNKMYDMKYEIVTSPKLIRINHAPDAEG